MATYGPSKIEARLDVAGPWWCCVQRIRTDCFGTFWGAKLGPLAVYFRANWPRRKPAEADEPSSCSAGEAAAFVRWLREQCPVEDDADYTEEELASF